MFLALLVIAIVDISIRKRISAQPLKLSIPYISKLPASRLLEISQPINQPPFKLPFLCLSRSMDPYPNSFLLAIFKQTQIEWFMALWVFSDPETHAMFDGLFWVGFKDSSYIIFC